MASRIQRKRTKGWRMPENAVSVCRPGPYGNPFVVTEKFSTGTKVGGWYTAVPTAEDAVACFRIYVALEQNADLLVKARAELRGRDLACFCALGDPCHADVWIEVVNE